MREIVCSVTAPNSQILWVTEAKVTADAPFDGVTKAEAAKMAAKALKDSGWLPAPLRALS